MVAATKQQYDEPVAVGQVYTSWPSGSPCWRVIERRGGSVVVQRIGEYYRDVYEWPVAQLAHMVRMA